MIEKIKFLEIEERLFVYALVFGIGIGIMNTVNNILIHFPFEANYKWIVLTLSSIVGIYIILKKEIRNEHTLTWIRGVIFSEIIFIFLPNGWLYTGGVTSSTMSYVFLICISICFVCKGFQRIFFIMAEIVVVLVLLCVSEYYPNAMIETPTELLFGDSLVQIPTTILASSIILIVFSNAFRKERQVLAEYSSMLIQKNQTLFQMTIKDELTGLYNRRYIFDKLQILWNALESYKAVRLALVDVDNFKMINDTLGHVEGDQMLKEISKIMHENIEGMGFAGRYGGDEFVLVFIDVEIESVMETLNQMNTQIKALKKSTQLQVSLSGGVSRLTKENNVDEALSRVDDILYRSKKTTKDQIISDEIQNRL